MRASTVVLDTGSGYDIPRRSAWPLGWQGHMCPDFKIAPVGDAIRNLLQTSSALILCIRFECALNKTDLFVSDHISVEELIGTRFMHRHVNSTF